MSFRILLSPPDVGDAEKAAVLAALDSGWVAPLGPEVDGFEADICTFTGASHAVGLSSGTAALHLALLELGVGPGDKVLVPTLTFGATAFAVTYTGAKPVFIDSEPVSWNIDPGLVAEYLDRSAKVGRLPKAVVPVDLFGRTADYDRLLPVCAQYDVPVVLDAAESLGATHGSRSAGTLGRVGFYSFNGNKIVTTSGGGMLVTEDAVLAERIRYRATQARQPAPWYEHTEIGFNYRMSNILAAIGRAQLSRLPGMIERRREIRDLYAKHLDGVDGMRVVGDPPSGRSNGWLTNLLLDDECGVATSEVIAALASSGVESRHVWKPMHTQPVFEGATVVGGAVAEGLFTRGICLPSSHTLADSQVDEVSELVRSVVQTGSRGGER